MFDYSLVVQSAVSSFNNAALYTPSFLWSALLSLPLFFVVYILADNIIRAINWNALKSKKLKEVAYSLCIEGALLFWLIFAHSEYGLIRDSFTLLPILTCSVIFVLTASVVQKIRAVDFSMPTFWENVKYKKLWIISVVLLVSVLAGISGAPKLWVGILQFAAVFAGIIFGSNVSRLMPTLPMNILMVFAVSVAVLMQPEFFKFGQLGNLTYAHLFFILLLGALSVAAFAVQSFGAANFIRHSAYSKLKWLARIMIFLGIALFVFTESVPVFLGLSFLLLVVFGFSVLHQESIPEKLPSKIWALMTVILGIVISVPLISILGILYFKSLNDGESRISDAKFLL